MKFSEFNFHPSVLESIEAMRFEQPTPIQEQAIPVILENKDLIGCAQTGTGKTAAYLLPIIHKIATSQQRNKISTLIIAPTRELALQIDQQLEGFSYFSPVTSIPVYGGNDSKAWDMQKKALTSGADFVIATPGRLISHLSFDYVDFSGLKYLILDEADRMLDMGFYDDIVKIIKELPKKRQTLLFSATMPGKIRQLANTILNNAEQINIATAKPSEKVIQGAYLVYDEQKVDLVKHLLKDKKDMESAIIFSSTKRAVNQIVKALKKLDLPVEAIHSDLEQKDRERVMLGFRNKEIKILVATDIVSRGIDVEDVELILNYDIPRESEDYVHRIGRTARAGSSGVALSLINPSDIPVFRKIESLIEDKVFKIPLPEHLGKAPEYKEQRRDKNDQRNKSHNKRRNYKKRKRS